MASKLALLKEMLDSAESNIRSARQIMAELTNSDTALPSAYKKAAAKLPQSSHPESDGEQVMEGVFNGQHMIGPDGKTYPVPANYASKSKLIPGDVLKLTIMPDGTFLYKQIGPVDRKRIVGTLVNEDGQYKVLGNGKAYKVLLASVTYFRASIGDRITIIVPELEESEWAAIENVLPASDDTPI